jgi:protein-tyrosine phosphatase
VAVIAAVAAAATGLGVWVYHDFVRDRIFPKRFGIVEQGLLYRSGQLHPALVESTLREHGIRRIVDLTHQNDLEAQLAERQAAERLAIERVVTPLEGDGTGDIEQYAQALAAIDRSVRSGEPTLVHCAAGTCRTGGVVASYRTLVQGWPAERALREMEEYEWESNDPIIPEYLDRNMPALARRLVELGVLRELPEVLPRFSPEGRGSELGSRAPTPAGARR